MANTWPRTNRFVRLMISSVLVIASLPAVSRSAEAALPKPTLLGLATENFRTDLPAFSQQTSDKSPAILQEFWRLDDNRWAAGDMDWVPPRLEELEAHGVVPYVEITTNDLDDLNQGGQNDNLAAMADIVADHLKGGPNRYLLIAPLPEMNLSHPWGTNAAGFKDAYNQIRLAFLDQGLTSNQIRFVFAPNGTSDVGEYDDYYPGDAVVDIIGFARVNRGTPWLDYHSVFQTHIDDLRSRVSMGKPILITQTGSVDQPEDRDVWLEQMFANLKSHDQVIGAIYFNRDTDHDYRVLENGTLDAAFSDGYQSWSDPSEISWIFDGRMDAWVEERSEMFPPSFIDTRGHIFQNAIMWLAEEGITQGCNPPANTRFCPDEEVTRGQMAVFIARARNLPAPSGDHFSDDQGQFYESAANRLLEAGITVGCAPNLYCGEEQIPREQMAAFLARILGLHGTSADHFVDDDGTFENAINKLAEAGITAGCNPPANDRYCPKDLVTRGQMAAFLRRALGP